MNNFDIIIIGAGPGGYEMAAVAAQNELSVGIVEQADLGGTCLNRGCIPTKALCRNAEVLNLMKDATAFGVTASDLKFDYKVAFERKSEVVRQLRDGVAMLLNNPLITVIEGEGKFKDAHTVTVGDQEYSAKNIVLSLIHI